MVQISANKIAGASEYCYTVKEPGTYSFCVQYDDESYNYYTVTIIDPNIPTAYGIHVSNAFSNNMIIQRDKLFTVWGTAKSPSGTTVLCEVNGAQHWLPHEGEIITGENKLTVDAGSFELLAVRYGRNTEHSTPVNLTLCNEHKMPAVAFIDYKYAVNSFITMTIDSSGWDIYTPRTKTDYAYRYGPTIITNEDGSMDVWFSCTGSNESQELDYFTHKHSSDGGMSWGEEKIVLSPTGLSKDRLSVCDPAAIYFNGYYYLGYTCTLDKGGYTNHGFVQEVKIPTGLMKNGTVTVGAVLPSL